jgi:hypothetical protein
VLFVGFAYLNNYRELKSLKENTAYTPGVILKIQAGGQGKRFVYYEYAVDGQQYQGTVSFRSTPTLSACAIISGNSCTVAYDKTNPEVSTIYKNFKR